MCRIFVPLAFALTAFSCASVLAQTGGAAVAPMSPARAIAPPLTLANAVQLALAQHPELAAARREVDATLGALDQAGVYQNPALSVELEDLRQGRRTTTVMLSQPLELGGKRAARVAAAERAADVARAQLQARQSDLRAGVTAAFFDALIAQERVQLAQASLALAQTGSQAAGQRVQAGKVSPVEETRARLAEAGVRLELMQAQGELQIALQQLRALTAGASHIEAVDGRALALPAPLSPEAVESRIANAPPLQQARLEVRRLGALADLESTRRVPDITVSAGIKRAQDAGSSQAVIGISVPLPVFDRNRGSIVEALRRQDKAQDEAQAIELRLRADVAVARQRQAMAVAEVAALQADILPRAQSAFDAASQGFALGKFGYLEALDAQRSLLQARAQQLRAVADAHRAATDLERLLGAATPNSLP